MKLQSKSLCAAAAFLVGLPLLSAVAQTAAPVAGQTTDTSQKADSPAMVAVRRAINSMGGDAAWSGVGSASLQLSITNSQNQKSFTTVRQDDWSKGYARMRADTAVGMTGKTVTTLDLPGSHSSMLADKGLAGKGTAASAPQYDLVTLAAMHPAAALRLAMSRSECQFKVLTAADLPQVEDVGSVQMDCTNAKNFGQHLRFVWSFDDSGMVRQVKIPVVGLNTTLQHPVTLRFTGYQRVQGLAVPVAIETVQGGRVTTTATVSSPSFQTALSDETFSPNNSR